MTAEAVARMDRIAEIEGTKAQNIIENWDEIHYRSQREWFCHQTGKVIIKGGYCNEAVDDRRKSGNCYAQNDEEKATSERS